MSINILAQLDKLIGDGAHFRGAVFLTYSLNLHFFEQLIQPKLEALGCTHVVILADIFGYQEEVRRSLHQLSGVGRQYICAPVHKHTRGVQHSKLLMLVSEHQGWMVAGSGNLTLFGYGQNLELFDLFESDNRHSETELAYPFQTAWRSINNLIPALAKTAQEHLEHFASLAPWLNNVSPPPDDFALWDSFDRPLYDQLTKYDLLAKLGRVDELHLIAPFIDISAVQQLIQHFSPLRLIIGADALNANVDGQSLAELCKSLSCDLELRGLSATNSQVKRGLHAKAIIGIHQLGSWCLIGSANITRPALLDSWRGHGNMETEVFRIAADPNAFKVLWYDELITFQSLSMLDAVINEEEPKEQSAMQIIRLVDLVARDKEIQGQVVFNKTIAIQELKLSLCLSNTQYLLALDDHNRFSVRLERSLLGPEAAVLWVLCDDNTLLISAETFIDQLYELERYGARSFHRSMHSKLELIPDAARTFKELMDFLFQRTDRHVFKRENSTRQKQGERRPSEAEENDDDERGVLPASAFITNDELTYYIGRRIDTLNPFDRDHYSLRDLLSLALLRLTTETAPSRVLEASVENEEDEQVISEEVEEQRQIQRTWQEWLVQYLTSYCRRYSQRLQNASFLLDTGPELLLQNHHTLVRVLLEFHARTEVFTSQLLRETVRQIWAPFFKTSGVISTLGSADWAQLWADESMTKALITMLVKAWSDPLPKVGVRSDTSYLQRFIYAQRLIHNAEQSLGKKFWLSVTFHQPETENIQILVDTDAAAFEQETVPLEVLKRFGELAAFKTPTEQRFEPCIRLMRLRKSGRAQSAEAKSILAHLQENEPGLFQLVKTASNIACVVGERRECPISQIELPDVAIMQLRRGEIIRSPYAQGYLLYWMPELDEEHVVL